MIWKNSVFVALGGGAGSVARYLISTLVQRNSSGGFPWGTLVVNLAGCFAIGILYGLAQKGNLLSNELRLLLAIGFCGGFTTFSTFANEGFTLLRSGEYIYFFSYIALSFLVGIFLVFVGYSLVNLNR